MDKAMDFCEDNYSASLRGPKGVGKSFLLLLLMLKLRADDTNRVIYLNNPSAVRDSTSSYIANELIYAFYRDIAANDFPPVPKQDYTNKPSTFEQWYQYMISESRISKSCSKFLQRAKKLLYG